MIHLTIAQDLLSGLIVVYLHSLCPAINQNKWLRRVEDTQPNVHVHVHLVTTINYS